MQNKELLIVYNTFGGDENAEQYIIGLKSIFWHINQNNLNEKVRVVVSSVLNFDECVNKIIDEFGEKVKIFRYDYRWPVQVSFNKTVDSSIKEFNENYNGYLYMSAGTELTEIPDLFPRLIEKNNSGEYGIINLYVNEDNCHEQMCGKIGCQQEINFFYDYVIPIKHFCNFHVGLINKEIREFYGLAVTDVFGKCGMEIALSFICYALRKKYILIGNSFTKHTYHSDSNLYINEINGTPIEDIPCGLNWGRTHEIFLNDKEGIESGLGYWPGIYVENAPWKYFIMNPDLSKYDENYFSTDERLKHAVKRCYFSNNNEIEYNKIKYKLI